MHASQAHVPTAGRILGSTLQQKLDELFNEDPDLCCPVSLMIFSNPVIASDGFIYDQASLSQLLENRQASPMTREILKSEYRLAVGKKQEVISYRKKRCQDLLNFVKEASSHQHLVIAALERFSEYVSALDADNVQNLLHDARILYARLGRAMPENLQPSARNSEGKASRLCSSATPPGPSAEPHIIFPFDTQSPQAPREVEVVTAGPNQQCCMLM